MAIKSIEIVQAISNAVHNKHQSKGLKMVINSLTILIVVGAGLAAYFSFKLGQEVGYDRGIVEGRKALRKQFEQAGR